MQNLSPITVIKASGIKEPFSEEKVIHSLSKSGLSLDAASQTVDYLKHYLKPEITTGEIYSNISSYLKENAPVENYFNYGLKRAIMDMGPSGFPFEIMVSDLLKLNNYKTAVGVITQGKCVTHEIDIIAQRENKKYIIECKYHNTPGYKTDIQVALYTYARFLDVANVQKQNNPQDILFPWLITNTKVTSDVMSYGQCVGLLITTWNQPKGGLEEMIISSGLHPVTLLYNIPKDKIQLMLDRGIVTCVRLKNAILNGQVNDILDENEKSVILKNVANICKENE
jgi:hypothetical protein